MFKDTIYEMLDAELETDLDYEKQEKAGKLADNRCNWHLTKMVHSELGEFDLTVPRNRNGTFKPTVVKKKQKNVTGIEDQFLTLYAKGVSTLEIQDHLNQLYGIEVSPTLISNVTGKFMSMIKE